MADLGRNFLAGFGTGMMIRRNLEETRVLIQDREDRKAAKEIMAGLADQLQQVETPLRVVQAEWQLLQSRAQEGEEVTPEEFQRQTARIFFRSFDTLKRKQDIFMRTIAAAPGNRYVQENVGAMAQQNFQAFRSMGEYLQTGLASVTRSGVQRQASDTARQRMATDVGIEGMRGERAALQRGHEAEQQERKQEHDVGMERLKHELLAERGRQRHEHALEEARAKADPGGLDDRKLKVKTIETAWMDAKSIIDEIYLGAPSSKEEPSQFDQIVARTGAPRESVYIALIKQEMAKILKDRGYPLEDFLAPEPEPKEGESQRPTEHVENEEEWKEFLRSYKAEARPPGSFLQALKGALP